MASSLYGLIVGGVVLATSPGLNRLSYVALSVVATLAIYWFAETYVHLMAERQVEKHELNWRTVRAVAADGLPLITVTALPLAVLLVAGFAGFAKSEAVMLALSVNTALIFVAGFRISREAGLVGWRLLASAAVSGVLGLVMIALKSVLVH